MKRLAKVGFSQSYSYFTWRNEKWELEQYLTELTTEECRHYMRPNFFTNTPDINPLFLQTSGRPGFRTRLVLAATLAGNYGIYNGFEICEAAAIPGKEEYLDSEKYQLRAWDMDQPGNIKDDIRLINRLRREHPALQSFTSLKFYNAFNDNVLYYGKMDAEGRQLPAVPRLPRPAQCAGLRVRGAAVGVRPAGRRLDRGAGPGPRQPFHLARQGPSSEPRSARAALCDLATVSTGERDDE